MKLLFPLLMLMLLVSCKPKSGTDADHPEFSAKEVFKKDSFKDNNGNTLLYNILDPVDIKGGERYPLMVFLHGAGERGDDNEAQLMHIAPIFAKDSIRKVHPSYVIFPQCPEDDRWGAIEEGEGRWIADATKEATTPMEGVMALIDQLITDLPIDTNRIYISGLSMGGYGTYDILSRRPNTFAAAVSICGGGDINAVSRYAHVPMKIFHGTKDSVVPVQFSRDMYKALKGASAANVEYIEYPEGTHNVWDKAYAEPTILDWIYSQKK